ncbi:Gmad2 immunoglobulin-like domain-containing protein [Nocardioides salarius]|uniref:Gmad2 immunoglobulin-like domain-containing protein n=1 Tax=Nocardioides salarius TaxID=374513 RepID=UPI0030FAEDAA
MSTHERDADLARLLGEAVDDVEPTDRLDEIRARTTSPGPQRRWVYAGGAALAAAAAVTAVAVLGPGTTPTSAPDPAEQPSATTTPSTSPSTDPPPTSTTAPTTPTTPPVAESVTAAVYYLGDTPRGPRLYREFQAVPGDGSVPLAPAVRAAVEGDPDDPDYRSPWAGTGATLTGATGDAEIVMVDLTGDLRLRPVGLDPAEAALAVEQVVRTAQAAVGSTAPVQLLLDGERTDQLLGVPVAEPLAQGEDLDVLALVSISDPAEGQQVEGTFTARGRASSFEATVPWEVRDATGAVVLDGFSTAEGWMERLYPWEAQVDVSGLEPGRYTFVAMTSDPSDGESGGPMTDTRTIVVP